MEPPAIPGRFSDVVRAGVWTRRGIEKATTQYLGPLAVDDMVAELRNDAPLMIEVEVGSNFDGYDGTGIYRSVGPGLPHAMCVLGYGTDAFTQEPYWIAKNSYGLAWGQHGFVQIRWEDDRVQPEQNVHAMRDVQP